MNDCFLSCIIPTYNEGKILKKQILILLNSLAKQFNNFEVIIVNDGSTDDSQKIIESLAQEYSCIIPINNYINLNMGISVQRGYVVAKGDYVTFNAVDLPFDPDHYIELIDEMVNTNSGFLVAERKEYAGTTRWRKFTSAVNRALMSVLFPVLKRGIHDLNYFQIVKREYINDILPISKSPIFTWPEMIFLAKKKNISMCIKKTEYRPKEIRPGAFGKPHDIIWGIYDMLRFRIRLWNKKI